LDRKALLLADLDESLILGFARHLPRCRCRPNYGRYVEQAPASLTLFRDHLVRIGVTAQHIPKGAETKESKLQGEFEQWMRQHRGVIQRTLDHYRPAVASFLDLIGGDPSQLDSHKIRQFILDRAERGGTSNLRGATTAVRTFLRYLVAEGKCPAGLDAALPPVAQWRLSTLPRYLPAGDVERIVAVYDSHSPNDLRNRAIVLLLARLGLRANDVAGLRLGDVDWEKATLRLSGKGRREALLPLPQEVGDALIDYLLHGRPAVDSDRVFIRSIAPLRPFSNSGLISKVVRRAIRRAGITAPSRGAAHLLRHSAATEMLRQGMSLQDIASILRHRSVETTNIYAKVDPSLLRLVVLPWPEEVRS